jgi:hypothetical protein
MDWIRLAGFFIFGKVCIYTLQSFPPTFRLADWLDGKIRQEFFGKLARCQFCLGVWVFAFWTLAMQMYPLGILYVPVVSEFIIGASASLIMFLLSVGWDVQFRTIQVGG